MTWYNSMKQNKDFGDNEKFRIKNDYIIEI